MSDKGKKERPQSRRPSYLSGSAGTAKTASAQETAAPAKEEAAQVPALDKEIMRWKVWLLPRRPAVSVAVVVTLIACIGVAYWAFPNLLFVGIITFILVNRLAPYLFPVTYILTEQTAGYKTFAAKDIRPWSKMFTYYEFPDGVLFANDVRGVRGRMREGLFMYYELGAPAKDQILDVVRSKLKPPTEAMAPKPKAVGKGGIGSAIRRIRKTKQKD